MRRGTRRSSGGPCTAATGCLPRGAARRSLTALASFLATAFVPLPVTGQSPGPTGTTAPAAVATIDDEPLSVEQFAAVYTRQPASRRMTAGTPAEQRQLLEAMALEALINERLLAGEARRKGVIVDPQEVEERIERKVAAAKRTSLESFLQTTGDNEDNLRHQTTLDMMIEKLIQPQLSDAALRAEYNSRKREFDGSRVRVSHVVLRPETSLATASVPDAFARAEKIRLEILRGDLTFAEAARRYSAGPSRHRGGDIGFIGRAEPMNEEFSAATFALAKGDISRPFATPFGIHLATVTEIEPGKTTFEGARGSVLRQVSMAAFKNLLSTLRAKARIVYSPGIPHFPAGQPGRGVVVLDEPDVVEPGSADQAAAGAAAPTAAP